jgi:methylmalonyl-CoA mutase, N-terminal domain
MDDIRNMVDEWYQANDDLPPARLGEHGDHGDTGEPIAPLYSSSTVDIDEARDLGVPGSAPFTRGAYSAGYRKRAWHMVQYVGFGTADETNLRWRALIGAGQPAVSLAFDLPSHLGFDSDDPMSLDEVGKAGVAVDSLADFEVLFDGIDLSTIPATFNTAAIAPVVVAMYRVMGERQGVSASSLTGTVTNDPLSSSHRGTCMFPAAPATKVAIDVVEYCLTDMPRFTPINVQGVYMRSVGATKAQETGYAMANALAYLDEAVRRGLAVEDVAARFSFFFQCDSHFFEEAAKFRASRRVWAELLAERYGTQLPNALRLRATGVSAARCFTKEEPLINLMRGAYSALGCALGGVQGMWISGFDEAYATPTEQASTLALRTMQILSEETGVRASIDPLGGSYFVEHLTERMAQMIRGHVDQILDAGGAVQATDSGFMRRCLLDNDMTWLEERESGTRRIVGHNWHRAAQDGSEAPVEFQRFRPEVAAEQLERLDRVRRERDADAVRVALAQVRERAEAGDNVMPAVVNSVRSYATVGEIMAELRTVHGEWSEPRL